MLGDRLTVNFVFNLVLAAWVLYDARVRRAAKPIFAAILTLAWGPLGLAFWASERPIARSEKRAGGTPWTMARTFALTFSAMAPAIFVLVVPDLRDRAAVPGSLGDRLGVIPASALITTGALVFGSGGALLIGWFLRQRHVRETGRSDTPSPRLPMFTAIALAAVVAFATACFVRPS
jgi:hypothetical protein